MLKHDQVIAIVGIAGLALVVQLLLKAGLPPSAAWLDYAEPAVAAVLLALWGFDRTLWHWPMFRALGGRIPDLRGTWKTTLRSSWVNPETNAPGPPIEAYMVVRQTFSTLSLRLMTAESSSELLSVQLLASADDTFRVAAIYRNEPKVEVRHRSQIHYGGLLLTVQGEPPSRLEGHYWTDRNTRGDILLETRDRQLFARFDQAKSALADRESS